MAILDTISGFLLPMPSADTPARSVQGSGTRPARVDGGGDPSPVQFGQALQEASRRPAQAAGSTSFADISASPQQPVSIQDVSLQPLNVEAGSLAEASQASMQTVAEDATLSADLGLSGLAETTSGIGQDAATNATTPSEIAADTRVAVSFVRPVLDSTSGIAGNMAALSGQSSQIVNDQGAAPVPTVAPGAPAPNSGLGDASSDPVLPSGFGQSQARAPAFAGALPAEAEASGTARAVLEQLEGSRAGRPLTATNGDISRAGFQPLSQDEQLQLSNEAGQLNRPGDTGAPAAASQRISAADLEPAGATARTMVAASLPSHIGGGAERRLIGESARSAARQGASSPSVDRTAAVGPNGAAARALSPAATELQSQQTQQAMTPDMPATLSSRQGPAEQNIARDFQALLLGQDRAASAEAIASMSSNRGGGLERALSGFGLELSPANASASSSSAPAATPSSAPAAPAHQQAPQAPATPAMQVGLSIGKAAAEGRQRFTLRLDPPELGRIDVKLEMGGEGHLRAVIRADSRETLELLQRDARHLERTLTDAGVKTDSGSLNFSLNQQGQNGGLAFSSDDNSPLGGREDLTSGQEEGAEDQDTVSTEDMTTLELTAAESDSIDIRV